MMTASTTSHAAMHDDRRSFPRFAFDVPILLASGHGWAIARTRDLSRGGIRIVGSNAMAIARLRVTHVYFELPKLAGIETTAHLVRSTDEECAFEFDACTHDTEVALRSWLHSRILRAAWDSRKPTKRPSGASVKS